ncbi:uncharacterized protein LOC134531919 [Bacillus rossius redtenbacheri]|uniref:uncharacterized protein LOC134531919 n=1 Tax=Bacillus rossius redtenbacheri TaxID=93214 RepID=UPI002FDDA247
MLNELLKSRKYAGDIEGVCIQVSGCFVCGEDHDSGKCHFLRHVEPIVRVEDSRSLTYARLSLPASLEVLDSADGTPAVVARTTFARGTQFGPFKARHLSELSFTTEFPIKVFRSLGKDNDDGWFLDTSDENSSNWMCLVSPATSPKNQNLMCYQDSSHIYYVALKDIQPGEKLCVYYAPYYAVKLGKLPFQINGPTKKDSKSKLINKPEKHKENEEDKRLYKEMLLNKEVASRLAEGLPASRLGARKAPERWRCRLCGVGEAGVVKHARHLMSHYKPLLARAEKPRCHACGLALPTEKLLVRHKVEKHGLKLKRWCQAGVKKQQERRNDDRSVSKDEAPPSFSGKTPVSPREVRAPMPSMEAQYSPQQMASSSLDVPATSQEMQVSSVGGGFRDGLAASSRELTVAALDDEEQRQPSTNALHLVPEEMQVSSSELQSSSQETQTILLTTLPEPLFNNQSLSALLQDGQSDAIKSFFAQYQEDISGDLAVGCAVKAGHETLQAGLAKDSLSNFGLSSGEMFLQQDASSESGSRKNFESADTLNHISDPTSSSLANMLAREEEDGVSHVHIMIMTQAHEDGYSLNLTAGQGEPFHAEQDQAEVQARNGSVGDVSCAQQTESAEMSANGVLAAMPQYVLTLQDEEAAKKKDESGQSDKVKIIGNTAQRDGPASLPGLLEQGPPYTCDICQKEFHCSEYIYRHLRKHTGEFICISCKVVFARKESLVNHSCFAVFGSKSFTCAHCNKTFSLKKKLNRHMLKHTDAHTCKDCRRVYGSEKALGAHRCDKGAREPGPYRCPVCSKEFQRRSNLDKHLPLHAGARPCVVCGKKLRAGGVAGAHEALCTQGKVLEATGSTPCPRCPAVLTQLAQYRQHVYRHSHPLSCDACGRRFAEPRVKNSHVCPGEVLCCDVCREQFSTLADFQSHQLCHGVPRFHCYECGCSFHNSESLSSCCHKANAVRQPKKSRGGAEASGGAGARDAERALMCQVCGETYKTAASLKSHMVLHGERKFECEVCHKRFFRKDVLQEHHSVHQEAQFPCPECNKLLKTKKSLDFHMMRHTGKKRFACSKCPKEFFQKANLIKHSAVHEPAASRRLTCRTCGKTFSSREYFAQHELEHTQGRIFQCDVCGKSFIKKHLLKSHVKKHHGQQSYLCPYCNVTFVHWNSIRRHLQSQRHSRQQGRCPSPGFADHQLLQSEVASAEILSVPAVPLQMAGVTGSARAEGSEPSLDQSTVLLSAEDSAMPMSAYILEEGSVIQPEAGEGGILLYVLDAVPSTDAYEELA